MWQSIVEGFREANLGLKLVEAPLAANPQIFQMDIHAGRSGEYFRVWPGARGNVAEVLDPDRGRRQLVLRVAEPRRRFEERVRRFPGQSRTWAEVRASRLGGRVVAEASQAWVIERWTPAEERRYLCGMDESHLFIAQVRQGSTVAEAHEALKPAAVHQAEERLAEPTRRQGEWFFVPASSSDAEFICAYVSMHPRSLRRESPVGDGGRPHVAETVARIDRRRHLLRREVRFPEVFAMGWVRHPDHREIVLPTWHRVIRNAEVPQPTVGSLRVQWID